LFVESFPIENKVAIKTEIGVRILSISGKKET
jgi:hypothetical protein